MKQNLMQRESSGGQFPKKVKVNLTHLKVKLNRNGDFVSSYKQKQAAGCKVQETEHRKQDTGKAKKKAHSPPPDRSLHLTLFLPIL